MVRILANVCQSVYVCFYQMANVCQSVYMCFYQMANECQSVYVCFYQTYQAPSRHDLPSSAYFSPCPLLPENRSDDLVASTLPSPVSLSLVQKEKNKHVLL